MRLGPLARTEIFSQPPPRKSWTGRAKVPLAASRRGAAYVAALGCAASLRDQLAGEVARLDRALGDTRRRVAEGVGLLVEQAKTQAAERTRAGAERGAELH